jgi:poly(glycerol-phosphate) alpha-glucosyltransferase
VNIAHLTQSVSTLGGGISEVIRALATAQHAAGDDPQVASVVDGGEPLISWPPGNPHLLIPRRLPGMLLLPDLKVTLDRLTPHVTHVHGLWTYLSIGVPRWADKNRVPSVVSPHGMLDAWALANSRWKKRIAVALFERRHLDRASCLHALCESEAKSIRAFGEKGPVAIIPNGIELPQIAHEPKTGDRSSRKLLLFLGRLHPKKGLVNAVRAWAAASKNDGWQFVVTGWDQDGHEAELKKLCDELELSWIDQSIDSLIEFPGTEAASVIFTGPAFGPAKASLLEKSSAFILPSFSEGLPMSILEAWAYHLPVLMTDFCNLPEGFEAEAAIRIGTDPSSITEGLRTLFTATDGDLRQLAMNGRILVERKFTWKRIAADMRELYLWIAGGSTKPPFVE